MISYVAKFVGFLALLHVFLGECSSARAQGQSSDDQATASPIDCTSDLKRPDAGANVPTGFMDIEFGTPISQAEEILSQRGYRFQKRDGWQLILKNVPLAGQNADQASLSFGDAGFYKGEAQLVVLCDKQVGQGTEVFEDISRTIHSKYRKLPETEEKGRKDKRNYWTTTWEFRTKDNKETAYEIHLYLQDEWKTKGGDWRKSSRIFITYLAAWAAPSGPTPPKAPSHGL